MPTKPRSSTRATSKRNPSKRNPSKRNPSKRVTSKSKGKKSILMKVSPHISIVKRIVSYTSNPPAGQPYGHVMTVAINNGKMTKSEANLNKRGQPLPVKR